MSKQLTIEELREQAKEEFHKTNLGKNYLRRLGDAGLDHTRYFSDLEVFIEGYLCAKANGILKGCKDEPKHETVQQCTIEQLRAQFNVQVVKNNPHHNFEQLWEGWLQCAKANGILKETEE